MLPYSIAFFIGWVLLLIVWILVGLPLGPEASLYYNPG
jgi:aminobenzoyl-glutamate transport protein